LTILYLQALIENWNYQKNLPNASAVVTESDYYGITCLVMAF